MGIGTVVQLDGVEGATEYDRECGTVEPKSLVYSVKMDSIVIRLL